MNTRRRDWMAAVGFAGPACLLIAWFVVVPAIKMASVSGHRQALTAPERGPDCGLDNYRAVIDDPDFRQALRNTVLFAVLAVTLQTALALGMALWVDGPGWSRRALRWAVFLPTTLSLTVTAVVWKLLLAPSVATGTGLINGLLASIGLSAQPFLISPQQAMLCIVVMSVWQGAGLQMMIFLSGLQTIPGQQYEAAKLDGAGSLNQFRHVTLPGIAPTIAVVVTVTTILALKLFVQPYLMTRGGPMGTTQSLVQYIVRAAFTRRDLGLACAAGVIFLIAVALVTIVQRLAAMRWEEAE